MLVGAAAVALFPACRPCPETHERYYEQDNEDCKAGGLYGQPADEDVIGRLGVLLVALARSDKSCPSYLDDNCHNVKAQEDGKHFSRRQRRNMAARDCNETAEPDVDGSCKEDRRNNDEEVLHYKIRYPGAASMCAESVTIAKAVYLLCRTMQSVIQLLHESLPNMANAMASARPQVCKMKCTLPSCFQSGSHAYSCGKVNGTKQIRTYMASRNTVTWNNKKGRGRTHR